MNKDGLKSVGNDIGSFDTFFLTWQPKLLYFIEHLMKDHEAARDMCQEIFLKAWNMHENLLTLRDPESYLFRMAKNAIYNYFEHNKVTERYVVETLRSSHDIDNDTEEQLFASQLKMMIEHTIAAMPEQRRRVWTMSREQGLSNDEIATQLNISKRTVENHLSNALRQLRKRTNELRTLLLVMLT